MTLEAQCRELLERFEDLWSRRKPTQLRELWDPAEDNPFYIAEEIADPMYGWDTILPYWREAEQLLLKFTPGLAAMKFIMHWSGLLRGMEQMPLGLDVRVSALLRRTEAGWRFCHYVESPLGPFPYLQASYRANVDPDFLD